MPGVAVILSSDLVQVVIGWTSGLNTNFQASCLVERHQHHEASTNTTFRDEKRTEGEWKTTTRKSMVVEHDVAYQSWVQSHRPVMPRVRWGCRHVLAVCLMPEAEQHKHGVLPHVSGSSLHVATSSELSILGCRGLNHTYIAWLLSTHRIGPILGRWGTVKTD